MRTSDGAIRMISSTISCNEAPHVDIVILSIVEVMYLGGQFGPIAVVNFEDQLIQSSGELIVAKSLVISEILIPSDLH